MTAARLVSATSAWSVSLSPDAAELAYVSDCDGAPRLFVSDLDGNHLRAIDTGPEPVQEAHWSVGGGFIALLIAPGGSPRGEVWVVRPDGRDLRKVAGSSQGASYLGPWTHRDGVLAIARTTEPTSGVAELIDVETGLLTPLLSGGQPLVLDIDQQQRVALVRRGPRSARSVWAVDIGRGSASELRWSEDPGSTDHGRLSPDGRIAYLRSNAGRDLFALFAVSLVGGALQDARLLAERADAELEDVILTADGKMAALLWNRAGRSECDLLDLESGNLQELLLPEPVAHGGSFSKDGRWLALTLEGPTHPRAIYVLDIAQGSFRRVTSQPVDYEPATSTPMLERLRAADGIELSGWLYRPREMNGKPRAALLHLHGGPEAQERPTYNPLFQALTARGVAVFAPNIRGSSGFGRAFLEADQRERRWNAIADVATCARYLFDQGIATPETLACGGRSYGGYLTLAALVFHPDLFAAGVDICGMADFATFYRDTEPWIAAAAYPKYGHPQEDAALLRELSPIHRFESLRAPLLVVHGENDSNVPVGEARQVVARARERGVPVEFLLFPEEGHELLQRKNRERFVCTTVSWLEERLFGSDPGTLLGPDEPPAFRVTEGGARSPFLVTCDHAGRVLPRALGTLGLAPSDLERHIAWDIGAAQVAERLGEALGSFVILQTYSRLVIDCNRPLGGHGSIAEISEATPIPGNRGVTPADAARRAAAVFHPYHARIEEELERRKRASLPTIYIAVHSFTPRFLETNRTVQVGVLYGGDSRYAHRVLSLLRRESLWVVGDNEPYFVSELTDYGVIVHAERRSVPYVELEIRQDLIADQTGQVEWAKILSTILVDAADGM